MKFGFRNIAFTFATLSSVLAATVEASPLRLDYTVTEQDDLYHYDFVLSLDNHDSTWISGQGWNLFYFGGVVGESVDLKNFWFDALPDTLIEGVINGGPNDTTESVPLVGYLASLKYAANPFDPNNMWAPTAVGQSLTWSGTANNDLAQGSLFFGAFANNNLVTGNAIIHNEIGFRHEGVAAIPIPASLPLFLSSIAGIAVARNRKSAARKRI